MGKKLKNNPFDLMRINDEKDHLREYPFYPDSEDIYNKSKEEDEIDPEDTSKVKETNMMSSNEEETDDNESGNDLDIPGSELDDAQELNGNEDEENNYYSLGGDDHNDLDEEME